MMKKTLQKERVRVYCRHCDKEFEEVWICLLDSVIGKRYVVFCRGCEKLIGIYPSAEFIKPGVSSKEISDELHILLNK